MSAEQFKNDELVAHQLRFDIQVCGEPAINSASAKIGPPHEIKIDESHRALNSPASGRGKQVYFALIVSVLAATFGVTWIILNAPVLPFDLASVGGWIGNLHLNSKVFHRS